MPLDEVSRRYAETLFTEQLEEITKRHNGIAIGVRSALAARGLTEHNAGNYHSEMARVGIDHLADMVRARADTLLAAYERARQPINNDAAEEIMREVSEYCEVQGGYIARGIRESVGRANMPEAVGARLAETIARGASGIEARIRRNILRRRDEAILDARNSANPVPARAPHQWDVFISHASEDKAAFARPLADALRNEGLRVWYDEFTLTVGDRLRQSIDRGLIGTRYGVVVLSPNFFSKRWPQEELDGLGSREAEGKKVILPIWHEIDFDGVCQFSPTLAGRVAVRSNEGMPEVVRKLLQVIRPD